MNLFAYCSNNPVMGIDPTGHFAFFILTAIIGAVVGAGIAGGVSYSKGARGWEVVGWAALGALAGEIIGAAAGAGLAVAVTGNAAASITATYHGIQSLAWAYTLGGTGGAMAFVGNNLGLTSSYYPASDGFSSMTQITLQPGEYLQRIGGPNGKYVSPYFTDPFSLSLPYKQIPHMYNPTIYQVTQPITVTAGPAVPWFGQYGGGMQYNLGKSIAELIVEGILRNI